MNSLSLSDIARLLSISLVDANPQQQALLIERLAPLDQADAAALSFFENKKYRSQLEDTQAAAVIISAECAVYYPGPKLITPHPRAALAQLIPHFVQSVSPQAGIASTAVIGSDCQIDPTAHIGHQVCIGDRVVIGAGAIIGAGTVIADEVIIGAGTECKPKVTIMSAVRIGKSCILHSASVIGSDGFGYALTNGAWKKIPHIGSVIMADEVEIGAGTTIDRGTLGDTIIHEDVKIDNQVQIGHNVEIGAHTVVAGTAAIAGSAKIGRYCQIGGGSLINGHIEIADQVVITGGSAVQNSIETAGVYSSSATVQSHMTWKRNWACFKKLHTIVKRVNTLEQSS